MSNAPNFSTPRVIGAIAAALILLLAAAWYLTDVPGRTIQISFTESASYREAVARAEDWEQFAARVGQPATPSVLNLHITERVSPVNSSTEKFGILFNGPKGEARLEVVTTTRGDTVSFQRLHLWHGAEGFDLLQLP